MHATSREIRKAGIIGKKTLHETDALLSLAVESERILPADR